MKKMKKIFALLIAMVMVLGMSATVFAQTVGTAADGTGTITINNPAKGETYKVHKLFDATVDAEGNIAYTATSIPTGLTDFFEIKNDYVYPKGDIAIKDADGNITGTQMTDALKTALESWASDSNKTAEAVSNGEDDLVFQGLPYGYYVMTTTHKSDAAEGQEAKAAISVTSTKPTATINDKNINEPSAKKEADDASYSVGDTVTYTATFDAPNYMAKAGSTDGESEQVVSYTIKDTLPDFLSDVAISSVKVKQPGVGTDVTVSGITKFDSDGKIEVPWVNETVPTENHKYTSTYKAGSQIIVVYTAKVTSAAKVGAANENTISIMPNVDRGNGKVPYQETDKWNDTASITTHAAKLIKVDGADKTTALKGAKFKFKGLTLTGENGFYTVVSYDPNGAADSGTEVEVGSDGTLTIGGIDKGITLIGTETEAPKGYNKMTGTFNVPTIEMATTTTTTWGTRTIYYDADGKVVDEEVEGGSSEEVSNGEYASISDIPAESVVKVENNKGVELPATGGIGTTIFYIIGAILVIGAGVVLVTRRRMNAN